MLVSNSLIPIRDDNPTRTFAWVTAAIIVINVLIFLMEPHFGQPSVNDVPAQCEVARYFYKWGTVPKEVVAQHQLQIRFGGCPPGTTVGQKNVYLSLLTSMFLHGGFLHIAGNMLFLWIFGNNIEDRLGRLRYIFFYVICGILAGLAHVYVNQTSTVPSVGASGAIAGVLGAYLVLFPKARVTTLIPLFVFIRVVQLPAVAVLGIWFAMQIFTGAGQQLGGAGVAWMAHVGGFIAGMALVIPFGGRRTPNPAW